MRQNSPTSSIPRVVSLSSMETSCDTASTVAESPPSSGYTKIRDGNGISLRDLSSSILQQFLVTVAAQWRGLAEDFRTNGLPWTGHKCRSIISGGSGVLYCVPALFCGSSRLEQCTWIAQAFLSTLADYFCVDRDSWIHGIDRIWATTLFITLLARVIWGHGVVPLVLGIVPGSAFVLANRSKQELDLQSWIYCHFLWHLTSSISVSIAVYLLYSCPEYDESAPTGNYLLQQFC